jgi:PKD repeat protein
VNAGPDRLINEGDSVAFNGVATDRGIFDTLSYAWDLDYNGVAFTPDVFGPTASRVYVDGPAAKVAALRVWDNDGGETIDTVNVTVGNVGPTILGVTNDGPVGEGSPLTLAVSATDVGSDTLTFAFDWNNDGVLDAVNQPARVSHIWYDQGNYPVGISAYDGDGGQAYITTTVSAYNVAPTAVGGPAIARLEGSPIQFDGSASSDPGIFDPLTYLWDFGDGSPVTDGISVTHVYVDNNVYTTTLSVTDNSGAGSTDTVSVAILNANPIADAGSDREVDEGLLVSLVGTASDPGAADALSLAWDFDFDGVNFTEDATGSSSVDVPYPDGPANYLVAFRVRDDDYPYPTGGGGDIGEALDVFQVTVINLDPEAEAGGPYIADEGQQLTLSGLGRDVPADALTYQWDLDYDGVYDISSQSVITSWTTAGVYTVTLRVSDDDGGSNLDIAQVMIGNQSPIAEAGGPYTGYEGVPITLTGVGIDPNGDDPLTYTWDLDYDGIFETPGQVISDTWPDEGVYTVTLEVIDGLGGVGIDDAIVTVYNVPPVPNAGGPYTTTAGASVTLTGNANDVPADALTYAWDLDNDGTFETPGRNVNGKWDFTGTCTVVFQADDGDGGVATDATTVYVGALVPIAWFGASYFLVWSKRAVSSRRRADRSDNHSDNRRQRRDRWI